ncbi:carboxymuconolactone decarboxylase family protein [Sphingobium sp. Sx8-8]|uniref:carboxymuconolactone decarboxylase family protein n=1 Tax=Sphingobium sp. Sx8-8 TaxID=2933617 RepID=UPI001F5A965A|nr:carboxymuconolactone decarboxylase family protein [Sphingobium sp. Sx8-8]
MPETDLRDIAGGEDVWAVYVRHAPGAVRRMSAFVAPVVAAGHISEKLRELIWIGVDSVVTHLFPSGIALHAGLALKAGATVPEIIEVLRLATEASERSYGPALLAIHQELEAAGVRPPTAPPAAVEAARAYKSAFIARAGYWDEWMDIAITHMPDHFTAWLELTNAIEDEPALDAKSRALISIALCGCAPLANVEGVRRHSRLALAHGASAEEIYAAMQLGMGLGSHAYITGIDAMRTELERQALPA